MNYLLSPYLLVGHKNKFARILLMFLLANICASTTFAQWYVGEKPEGGFIYPEIPEIASYEVYTLDISALAQYVNQQGPTTVSLILGDKNLSIQLDDHPIIKEDVEIAFIKEEGLLRGTPRPNGSYILSGPDIQGRLILREDYMSGGFIWKGIEYMVEPFWYYKPGAPVNQIILYEASIAQIIGDFKCGTDLHLHETPHNHIIADSLTHPESNRSAGCKEVEYAYASDWLFYQKYGSENAVMNRIETILSLVEWQYTAWFNDNFIFPVTGFFISACSTCDPSEWTNTLDPFELLENFKNWGELGGFGNTVYDVAGLWTDRVFNSSIVGVAYVSAICSDQRYHSIMDFTASTSMMRVLVSHELGHNFSYDHDAIGSNFIMAPNISNTTTWSDPSIDAINIFSGPLPCLSSCSQNEPPVASFSANPEEGCAPLVVQFTDQSSNNPTSWLWTFPGGSPASSTLQFPVVTYNQPGLYDVTLMATNNGGSGSTTVDDFILAKEPPVAGFTYLINQKKVNFFSQSPGATSLEWDFGDGATGFGATPIHTYASDGVYIVTLTAINECGFDIAIQTITIITIPIADFSGTPTEGCVPLTVAFTDLSTPNATQWNWQFPGGTPSASTVQHPVVIYNEEGVYSVSLTASNAAGNHTTTQINYIVTEALPTSGFTYTTSVDTVYFHASGGPDSVYWQFGDGGTSNLFHPSHIYAQEGDYLVSLTVYSPCGSDTYEEIITIIFPPVADFVADTILGCAPMSVQFNNQSQGSNLQFQWLFPGGMPSTASETHPQVTYALPGLYSVTLIANNVAGSDTLHLVNYIRATGLPISNFNTLVQNGNEVLFENLSVDGITYLWTFGDGQQSSDEDPVHLYLEEGIYTVILEVTNACATDTFSQAVEIMLPPQAAFEVAPSSGCSPFTVQFTDLSTPDVSSWSWTFDGGTPPVSSEANPVVTYAQPGSYDVVLVVQNAIGEGTIIKENIIEARDVPIASFSSELLNGAVQFINLSHFGVTYEWQFGDGETSNEENPLHHYNTEGFYVVTLLVMNDCGVHVYSQVIEVIFSPQANFKSEGHSFCANDTTIQFINLTEGQDTSWFWTFEGGDPAYSYEQHPMVYYSGPGSFDVQLIAFGPGGTDTLIREDYVFLSDSLPNAEFEMVANGLEVTFKNLSERGMSWFWQFGDGKESGLQNPIHIYSEEGEYQVTLIVENPCGRDTITRFIILETSAIQRPTFLNHLHIYPNPSTGMVFMEMSSRERREIDYVVVNMLGQQVYAGKCIANDVIRQESLDLAMLPSGLYYIRLAHRGDFIVRTLMIQP